MDVNWMGVLASFAGVGVGIVSFIYVIIRNLKEDLFQKINSVEKRQNLLDERMFFLATGQHLEDVIKRERLKELP